LGTAYDIRIEHAVGAHVIRLTGELGPAAALPVRRALAARCTGNVSLVIECAELTRLAPEVLATLVTCARLASTFETDFEIRDLSVDTGRVVDGFLRNDCNAAGRGQPQDPSGPAT
jgi:hypothetical protein